jgi:hypothetical protein
MSPHLVVVPPHEAGAPNEVISQAHELVDQRVGGHGTMVACTRTGQRQ